MAKIIKNKKIIFCLIVLGILTTSSTALALQVDWPDSPLGTPLNEGSELPQLIQYLYEWGIALGGLAAFVALLIAGFQFLTSAGNPTSMSEAKGRMQSAGIGLVLLLGSWLILYTINPELTTFKPLVMPAPGDLLGNCEFYYEIDPETGEKKEPPIQRENPQQYCKDNFGDDYECKDNICVINLTDLFKVKDCSSVVIKAGDKTATISKVGQTIDEWDNDGLLEITAGNPFQIEASPYRCMGTLVLHERTGFLGGCAGDKRTLALQPGVVTYPDVPPDDKNPEKDFDLDINIKCIKLEKI